jgi:hypothetical protein
MFAMNADEIKRRTVYVRLVVPYWGNDVPIDFPFRWGDEWQITVNIKTGVIENWSAGISGHVFLKVRDEGVYSLLDENKTLLYHYRGYVPNMLLPPINGFGDYLDLTIDANGKIKNWYDSPSLEDFDITGESR